MPTYAHVQEVKKAEDLPQKEKVGPCLTCRYWDVDEPRSEATVARVARCLYPGLVRFALIVSGASGCNEWARKPGVEPEAEAYAKREG